MEDRDRPEEAQPWELRPAAGWQEFQRARARLLRRLAEQAELARRRAASGGRGDQEERRPGDERRRMRIRRFADEAWNRGRDGIVEELFLPGHQYHDHFVGGYSPGPEGVRQHLALYREAFPDGWVTVEDIIAAGDRVAARWLYTGTHTGALRSLPATGRRVETTGVHLFRFVGDRVGETWAIWDSLSMVQQLGIVSPILAGEQVLR